MFLTFIFLGSNKTIRLMTQSNILKNTSMRLFDNIMCQLICYLIITTEK